MASCQTETDATWRFLFPHLSSPHPCSRPQERNSFSHIDCTNSNILRASWEKADTAAVMLASQSWKGNQFIHGRSPCQCGVRFWFTTNWCAKETVQYGWSLTFSFIRAVFWGSTEFFNQKDKKGGSGFCWAPIKHPPRHHCDSCPDESTIATCSSPRGPLGQETFWHAICLSYDWKWNSTHLPEATLEAIFKNSHLASRQYWNGTVWNVVTTEVAMKSSLSPIFTNLSCSSVSSH